MSKWFCIMLSAAVLLSSGIVARAAPIPDWALGRWVAVAVVESAGNRFFGEHYLDSLPLSFRKTQLEVAPSYLAESPSPYNLKFVWGLGVKANIERMPLTKVLENVSDPYVYGDALTYDPAQPVLTAHLTMETCAEDGGYLEPQVTPPLYRFTKIRKSCGEYSLFQFPDSNHIAMWRKIDWGANRGLVIFKRLILADPVN